MAFLLYGAWSVSRAAVPYDAYVESIKLCSFPLAVWIWSEVAGTRDRWRWLAGLFLLSVSVMAWYAIIQHAHGSRGVLNLIRPESYEMRASGAYFCPNHYANLLALTVPFAVGLVFARGAGLPLRLLAGYTAVVILPPLYLTQSRSGWIGVIVGTAVTASLLGLRKSLRAFAATLVVVPFTLVAAAGLIWKLSPMVQHRVAQALEGNIRLQLWQDTLLIIRDSPWLGFGPLSYRWVYPGFRHHMTMYLDPQYAHNDYLQLVAEYGLVGLALAALTLAAFAVPLLRRLRRAESDKGACLIAGLLGSVAATAAHACFDYNLHLFGNTQALCLLAGLTVAVLYAGRTLVPRPLNARAVRFVPLLAVVPLALLVMGGRSVATYGFALRGDVHREVFAMDRAERFYRMALRIDEGYWPAHLGLGHVWAAQGFWNRDPETRGQQTSEAIQHYERVRQLNAYEPESLHGLSRMHAARGEPEAALAALEELVRQNPGHMDFLASLGLQLRLMGRYPEALQAFERARAVGPSDMINRNLIFLRTKVVEAAK